MDYRKLHKLVEAINTYYAFALLIYVVVLYVSGHSQFFWWVLIAVTPFLAAWTGYLLKTYMQRRNQRYGFKVISDTMTYEITGDHTYKLRFSTNLKADANHLISYPVGYQWTGEGTESPPVIMNDGQQLLGVISTDKHGLNAKPYVESVSGEGTWHYWFVGLNPPLFKGDEVNIKYSQIFNDKKKAANPYIYYHVRTTMKKLELSVRFGAEQPKSVRCSYIKPSDSRRTYASDGLVYDSDKQWATWVIDRPKRGYIYKIYWE